MTNTPPNNTPPEAYLDQVTRQSREHLESAGEHYFEHLWFTAKMAGSLTLTGLIILMHGLIPSFFTTTGSSRIERMYMNIRGRIPASRRNELDRAGNAHDWHI